jgi:hypothetical protein
MKRLLFAVCLTMLLTGIASLSHAELKTIGTGANMDVDSTSFPPNLKALMPNFTKKCIKCHGMDRTYVTLQTGMTPSGSTFDGPAIEAYGAKMLRKPDADMSKQEVKQFIELMKYMAEEAAK